jgi:mono/diheme cytochrome c family protein
MHRYKLPDSLPLMKRFLFCLLLPCLLSLSLLPFFSCSDTEVEDIEDADDDSAAADDGNEVICGVTFNENIKPFFADYCVRCHSVNAVSGERNGAPDSANYDTPENVLTQGEGIRARLLDGGGMPPTPPEPNHIERDDIIAWIDCALK